MDDGDLRKSADRCDNEVIKFKAPIHHHTSESDEPFDIVQHEKESGGMSPKEATRALTAFMKSKGGLFLHFKQGNMKEGQRNEARYNAYKYIRTYDELLDAIKRKLISSPKNPDAAEYKSGDVHYDLRVGNARIGRNHEPATAMLISHFPKTEAMVSRKKRRYINKAAIKLKRQEKQIATASRHMMMFIDDAKTPNRMIQNVWEKVTDYDLSIESPEVSKRSAPAITDDKLTSRLRELYYQLNSGNFGNEENAKNDTLQGLIAKTKAADNGTSGEYMKSLLGHVAANAILGEEKTFHDTLSQEFALNATGEIVCGKVTPRTDAEARASEDWAKHWLPSLKKEVKALFDMGTFELVRRTDMEKLGSKTKKMKNVRKIKVTRDGEIDKYKTRMVVQGFSLLPNDEYYDSYSSVIGAGNTRTLMYIATQTGEELSSADVGNAFLEADLPEDEVVFVEQHPDAAVDGYPPKDWVLRLKKCLYGLPQAGRGFQRVYTKMMLDLGFKRSSAEDCLFIYHHPEHGRIMCSNYVDDLICLTNSKYLRDWWRSNLSKHFAKVTFADSLDYILGIKINRGVDSNGNRYLELDHKVSIEKIAAQAQVGDGHRRVGSPMDHSEKLRRNSSEDEEAEGSYTPPYSYPSILGSLMYLANLSRPDIVTAVHKLSRYVANPSARHYRALTRVVAFTYQTRDRFLRYTQSPEENDPFRLYSASDASYADCVDTGRSTIGRCLWMGKKCSGLIDWKSSLPKTAANSTAESELQAAAECVKDIVYARVLLHDMGYPQVGSTRVQIDNNACISQLNAVKGVVKARHYIVLLRKVQEAVQLGIVHTQRVDSADNVADMFTKPLHQMPFWRLTTAAMGDELATHENTSYRRRLAQMELRGGSVKELNDEYRAEQIEQKKRARESQRERREWELDDRRTQTAALVTALNAVVKVMERLETG